jgi:hypothetical protein
MFKMKTVQQKIKFLGKLVNESYYSEGMGMGMGMGMGQTTGRLMGMARPAVAQAVAPKVGGKLSKFAYDVAYKASQVGGGPMQDLLAALKGATDGQIAQQIKNIVAKAPQLKGWALQILRAA